MEGIQPYSFEPTRQNIAENEREDESSGSDEMKINVNADAVRSGNVSWCLCKSCRTMDTERESICFQEVGELNMELEDANIECITAHDSFNILFKHPDVLRTVCMHDVRCDSLTEPLENRTLRLAAYRQFTWLVHNYLGKAVILS